MSYTNSPEANLPWAIIHIIGVSTILSYNEALEFIHGIERFGSKPGLSRVKMLLERMGNPQDKLKFIHVAGSDGKGSTCTMISSIYTKAGYKTGLYISPFVLDFRERIQLNGEMISKDDLAASTSLVKEHWEELNSIGEPPTEFEVVVAIAMDYFTRMSCDLVVLEVGMGGRFDATNIIKTPLCSVITHLSMDHMQYLGDTIEKITYEKCGIIKEGGITVCYPHQPTDALAVIMEQCAENDNELHMPNAAEIIQSDIFGSDITYGKYNIHIPLPGKHQVYNAITAVEAVKAAASQGFVVSADHIIDGIASVRFPSRVEALSKNPLVLLDGGHNPAEAAALAATLKLLEGRKIHAVVGMLGDKDVERSISQVLPMCATAITVQANYPRALSAQELALTAKAYINDVSFDEDSTRALNTALDRCKGDDVLLVFGSLYLAAELRPMLLKLLESRI